MKGMFAASLLAFASGACAQATVFKCLDPRGNASYQSEPCAGGTAAARSWPIEPDPPFTPERIAADREIAAKARALERRREDRRPRPRPAAPRRAAKPSACEAARTHRERTLDAAGLKRDFDLLRNLDDAVARACK